MPVPGQGQFGSPQTNQLTQQPPAPPQPNQIVPSCIVLFPYLFWRTDPTPCVLVSSVTGTQVRGLNLHVLTFASIKQLLPAANAKAFSYASIRGNSYITSAFRSYLTKGILFNKAKVIDARFLQTMMNLTTSFDPRAVKAIRQQIEQQLYMGTAQPVAAPSQPTPFGSPQSTTPGTV